MVVLAVCKIPSFLGRKRIRANLSCPTVWSGQAKGEGTLSESLVTYPRVHRARRSLS